jgi:hypothetical protein
MSDEPEQSVSVAPCRRCGCLHITFYEGPAEVFTFACAPGHAMILIAEMQKSLADLARPESERRPDERLN